MLLGHTKLEGTVCYLGIEVDDALILSKQTKIKMGAAVETAAVYP